MTASERLRDRRILVVEDEFMLAELVAFQLRHIGALVIGPASNIPQALQLLSDESKVDAALIDVNLGGDMAFPIADALLARGIPIIFTTGYEERVIRGRYPAAKYCQKPVEFETMVKMLLQVLESP